MSDESTSPPLKLRAQDLDDLSVLSSMVQDALAPPRDMTYLVAERSFAVALNRFKWETVADGPPYERVHAGLRVDNVLDVQRKGIDLVRDRDRVLDLLALAYAEDEAGGPGTLLLQFAEDRAVRLKVESLAVALEDLGEPWPTQWRPDHEIEESG